MVVVVLASATTSALHLGELLLPVRVRQQPDFLLLLSAIENPMEPRGGCFSRNWWPIALVSNSSMAVCSIGALLFVFQVLCFDAIRSRWGSPCWLFLSVRIVSSPSAQKPCVVAVCFPGARAAARVCCFPTAGRQKPQVRPRHESDTFFKNAGDPLLTPVRRLSTKGFYHSNA